MYMRRWMYCCILTGFAFALGCSQNFSEKGVDQTLEEQGMHSVDGRAVAKVETTTGLGARKSIGGLSVLMPKGWEEVKPSSSMRIAEYRLPGEGEEVLLAVFYFGRGQGGSVQANIDRWIGQFRQPDGSDSRDHSKQWSEDIAGLPVTMVEVSGTYSVGAMSGGGGGPLENYRMLGAIVESGQGPFFFKLTGPEALVGKWQDSFAQYIKDIQPE